MLITRKSDYTSIKSKYSECMEKFKRFFPGKHPFEINKIILPLGDSQFIFTQKGAIDVIFIMVGEVEIEVVDREQKQKELLKEGDFAIFDPETFCTLINHSEKRTEILRITFLEKK